MYSLKEFKYRTIQRRERADLGISEVFRNRNLQRVKKKVIIIQFIDFL